MIYSKYLKLQFSIFILLLVGVTLLVSKYFTFLIHETVIYCQKIISQPDLIIRSPHLLATIIIGLAVFHIIVLFFYKLFREFYMVRNFEKNSARLTSEVLTVTTKYNISTRSLCLFKNEDLYAFCFGVINPKIYISTQFVNNLDQEELEAVLLHEYYHMKKRHSVLRVISKAISMLFPFFPILSEMHTLIKEKQEISADNFVVNKLQSTKPLVNVFKKIVSNKYVSNELFLSTIYEDTTIENRIKNLKNIKFTSQSFSLPKVCISIISSLTIVTLLALPVNATEIHNNGQDIVMICLNKDCQRSCEAGITTSSYINTQSISYPFTPYIH